MHMINKNRSYVPLFCIITALSIGGCVTTGGQNSPDTRKSVLAMKNKALTQLFKLKPGVRDQIKRAPGYAVFSNANVNIIIASFGGGHGVVKNMKTGKYTFMRMAEVGLGPGLGAKDFREVFIFHSTKSMNTFIEKGWQFGAQADAAAKAGEKGGAIGGETVIDNITVYQLTETGLALQATVKGTKYWKDDSLN